MAVEVLLLGTDDTRRAPLARELAVARCTVGADQVRFVSAGTHAEPGTAMHEEFTRLCRELGGGTAEQGARLLSPATLDAATIVLTATIEQRDFAIRLRPSTLRKAFTLKEFVRLGTPLRPAAGPEGVIRLIRDIAARRDPLRPGGLPRDEIRAAADQSTSEVLRCALEVSRAVDGTLTMLGIDR